MAHPLDAFKKARREHLHAQGAEERAQREQAEFGIWCRLQDHAGDEVVDHVTITLKTLEPLVAEANVKDHIPITITLVDDQLRFTLSRRHQKKTFEHFADALTFGEPYGASNPPPPAPAQPSDGTINTKPGANA